MNTLRQFFSVRTLAALKQTTVVNPVPVESPPTNRFSTATAPGNTNTSFIPKDCFSGCQLKGTKFGFTNEAILSQYKQLDRKLEIAYRCKICNTRNLKTISEFAYNRGVVILQCDGCSTNHLIKDNLGWFADSKGKSVSEILAEKGDLIRKIVVNEKDEIIN